MKSDQDDDKRDRFASPFAFVLQNYAFICAQTMFYCLNLNSFIGIAVKFAYWGFSICGDPLKSIFREYPFLRVRFTRSEPDLTRADM